MSYRDDTVTKVGEARKKGALLVIHAYCERTFCPVREFSIDVKDYDDTLVELVRGNDGVRCPVCGGTDVSVHRVKTMREQAEDDERDAERARVAKLHGLNPHLRQL